MRFHFITVGEPKLPFAKKGWDEYYTRLSKLHDVETTRLSDKKATDEAILKAAGNSYVIPLDLKGKELSSEQLSQHLAATALHGRSQFAFIIGGPDGFGDAVRQRADFLWKLSSLTFPHDLAMVVMLEAIYRAATIEKKIPYHR